MIRSEPEHQRALARLEEDQEVIEAQKKVFLDQELTDEEAEKALEPMVSFRAQLEDGSFEPVPSRYGCSHCPVMGIWIEGCPAEVPSE